MTVQTAADRTIEARGIRKAYGKKQVLADVTFFAKSGQCVGILGGNGSGKSTLFSILAGVRKADGGSFLLGETDFLRHSGRIPDVIGYVPQADPLMEELSAWDNLRMWHDKKTIQRELAEGALALLGIGDFLKTPVRKLSGGMRKRLSIACAVASRPEILVLDEPSAALDLVCKDSISRFLTTYKKGGGIVLLTTHDVQDLPLCDVCYILKEGSLRPYAYDGDPHRLAEAL
ncbi:MAG: ABC transporter ATP-binding protein [Bacteroidales bacterium]|nr:ABC transporter ATP-binding protein [Bacteroidales bacterium]MCM1417032.1 ABC transporter ATP-binding protein [bacterium]MCM1423093.1 ABC transporter ATP-binding protein [bacterium]